MSINTDINSLQPMTAIKARNFLSICKEKNIDVAVTETVRSQEIQLLYYLQGRLDVDKNKLVISEYNALRKKYGLWEVSEAEARGKIITWTLSSNHFLGRAFDVVPLKDGKPWWDAPEDVWQKLGQIGRSCKLKWGGDWMDKKDRPHFEDV